MEEQTTWKGHSFTLLVFTGIVVLCSIFFILGMLVGRGQGQRIALSAAAADENSAAVKPALNAGNEPATSSLYETPEPDPKLTVLDVPVAKTEPPAPKLSPPAQPAVPKKVTPPPPAPKASVMNYQISALRNSADAEKLLDQLKNKGFRAFILAPPPGDANPFFRVQVGPFTDLVEADDAKKKLESAGYKPILRK